MRCIFLVHSDGQKEVKMDIFLTKTASGLKVVSLQNRRNF